MVLENVTATQQLIISFQSGKWHCTSFNALRNRFWKALWWNYRSKLTTWCKPLILKSYNHLLGKVIAHRRFSFPSLNILNRCVFKWMGLCKLLSYMWFHPPFPPLTSKRVPFSSPLQCFRFRVFTAFKCKLLYLYWQSLKPYNLFSSIWIQLYQYN